MTVVGQVEIDPFCQRVLTKHWPEVPQHDDVRTCVEWWRSEPRPTVDLVCGGFPCQPVSVAGRQLGQADELWLWPAFADVLRGLRPRYAVLENVPGLLNGGMGEVLGDLAEIGYNAEWDCVPAASVGAPHLRDRVFIIAHVAHADRVWQLQQEGGVADVGRWVSHSSSPITWPAPVGAVWWSLEPDVGRVVTGVPTGLDGGINAGSRVNRIKALGNAVVPQVAEHIGRLVLAADRGRSGSPR